MPQFLHLCSIGMIYLHGAFQLEIGIKYKSVLRIVSVVIGSTEVFLHCGLLGFVVPLYLNAIFSNVYYGYFLMGTLSFYILLDTFFIIGTLKEISWILITWLAFTIIQLGLAFVSIHLFFSVGHFSILACISILIFSILAILIVEEYLWLIPLVPFEYPNA